MKDINHLKMILDHLTDTGIYVIRQDTHELLYFNERVKKISPEVKIGHICHEVWEGTCDNCPLKNIGDKETNTSINYLDPFGEAVEITATRMKWIEQEPVFLISISRHILSDKDEKLIEKMKKDKKEQEYLESICNFVCSKDYILIATISFIDSSYCFKFFREDGPFSVFPLNGNFDDIFKEECNTGFVFPEDLDRVSNEFSLKKIVEQLQEKKEHVLHYRVRYQDGSYRWIQLVFSFLSNDPGTLLAAARDIHNLQEVKMKEEIANQSMNLAMERIYDEIIYVNLTKKRIEFIKNRGTYGKPAVQWDEHFAETIYPSDQERYKHYFQTDQLQKRFLSSGQRVGFECRRLGTDGVYHWVMTSAVPMEDNQDGNKMVMVFVTTIDQQKELEQLREEQRKAELKFGYGISSLYDIIYEGNMDTNQMYNWEFHEDGSRRILSEYTFQERISIAASDIVHPDYQEGYVSRFSFHAMEEAYIKGHKKIYFETPRKTKEGIYRWHSIEVQLLSKDCIMYYIKDLDDAKREEEGKRLALLDALSIAEQANSAKTDFLSRMSHDIRTPMNAIIGMTTIAKIHAADETKVTDCLEKIDMSARFLLALINDILDMSKIESGKMKIVEEEFELAELLSRVSSMVETQTQHKNQRFCVHVEKGLEGLYLGDTLRLNQVLTNLLNNAVKFTNDGGTITLELKAAQRNNLDQPLIFMIEDTGIGMSDEFLEHIYEPFEQEQKARGRQFEGSGLGLSIAKNLVQMMHGRMFVESKLGLGSCFTVEIPLKRLNIKHSEKYEPRQEANAQDFMENKKKTHDERILLVEDNEINMEIARSLLEMEGYTVDMAVNGKEALDMFSASVEGYYSIILMDIRMPVMDGLEATKQIRKLSRKDATQVPVIAMTANAFEEEKEHARHVGMNDYLTKPFYLDVFLKVLKRNLRE